MKYFILSLVGIIAGFINVNAGGGSFLVIPTLILLGLSPNIANGTNRIGILAMTTVSIITFKFHGVSNLRFSTYLALPAIFGAYLGTMISIKIPPVLFKQILSVLMITMMIFSFYKPKQDRNMMTKFSLLRNLASFVGFFFIGLYGGLIQAGVGFLMILILRSVHEMSLKMISSIRVAVVFYYTIIPIIIFIKYDRINWLYGLILAGSVSFGGWIGTKWNIKKQDNAIKKVVAISVIIMAISIWFKSYAS